MVDNIQETVLKALVSTENNVPMAEMFRLCDCQDEKDDRKVRSVIQKMKSEIPIGSSSSNVNGGYYLIRTAKEKEEARGELVSRAMELLKSARNLDNSFSHYWQGQVLPRIISPMVQAWTEYHDENLSIRKAV